MTTQEAIDWFRRELNGRTTGSQSEEAHRKALEILELAHQEERKMVVAKLKREIEVLERNIVHALEDYESDRYVMIRRHELYQLYKILAELGELHGGQG